MARKINGRCVAGAFARWVEWTDEVLDMREKLALAVTRFAKRAMNAAFAKWAHITEVELNRKRILIEHVAKRMNRTVGFLFEQWWKYVDFELRMRATLEKAVKLMQNRVLGAAWSKWAHCVEEARAKRHFTRSCWRRWTFSVGLCKDESEREKKLAVVLKRMMFGNSQRVFAGWRLIIQRNKRFFRKQQALKRAISAGDAVIRQKRKALVILGWRAWRYQMVDQEKMALVKKMLAARLSAAKGTFFARWWSYVEAQRAELAKFASAKELRHKMLRRAALHQWRSAVLQGAAEMEQKLAKAMEWAFGASLAMTMSKWRAAVAEEKTKRRAMQRIVALLTGFGLENLGAHVLQAWLEVCREKQRGTAHLRKADNHRKGVVMEAAFLSWRVQAAPLSEADHLKALGRGRDDVWDKDYDSDDNPTELHATILVRRTRAMFDGRDPDSDDETRDDVEAAKKAAPASGLKGVLSRAKQIASKPFEALSPKKKPAAAAKNASPASYSSSSDDEATVTTPPGPGGAMSSRAPDSSAPRRCASCGAPEAKVGQKFCPECGARA